MNGIANAVKSEANPHLISHSTVVPIEQLIAEARLRIDDYPGAEVSKPDMLLMLDQLLEHPVGRSVFIGKGLDCEATQFFINGCKHETNPLICWIFDKAPANMATRERFGVFQRELQKRLRSGMHLASVPCGVMDDLLGLDLTGLHGVSFTGIDLDEKSLMLAKANAQKNELSGISNFHESDAWNLGSFEAHFDILTSNGLNIYVADNEKVIALYKEFFRTLKPGGVLITSFLTPPPVLGGTTWKNIDPVDASKQRILFCTVIGAQWQHFRSEETTKSQLQSAGFENIEVIYDSQGMFPTVVAARPLVKE